MTRIVVQPEHLRTLATQCRRQADDLRSVLGNLGGAFGNLDWQVREAANVEGTWQSARSRGYTLADQAETMARYLDRKAQAFAEADHVGAAQVGQVAGAFTDAQQQWAEWWQQRSTIFSFPQDLVARVLWLGRVVLTTPVTWMVTGLTIVTSVVGGLLAGLANLRTPSSSSGPRPPQLDQHADQTAGAGRSDATGATDLPPPDLRDADPGQYSSCALYAQARRHDLGPTGGDGGAYNYIEQYRQSQRYYRLPREATPSGLLQTDLRVGTAVVWERGQQGADATWGHVAIIEEVGPDYVEISEAGWGSGTRRRIPAADLLDLHFIL